MADISDFKIGQICWCSYGKHLCNKNRRIIWYSSKEYCLESNDSIWERRENLLTEAKLSKKAKAVW